MKYIFLLFVCQCFIFLIPAHAQQPADQIIFKAMQDEIRRNKEELTLPGYPSPYFLSYGFGHYRQFEIIGTLGSITSSFISPYYSIGSAQVLVGDYSHNSDAAYVGQIVPAEMPAEIDYDPIRRGFWLGSDMMYKWSLQSLSAKETFLKANPLTAEETRLADQEKVPAIRKIIGRTTPYRIDPEQLQDLIRETSAVFKNYKDIYNSMVGVTGIKMDIYRQTSDSVSVKQPGDYVRFFAEAYVITQEGTKIYDSFSIVAASPGDLPVTDVLRRKITDFAEGLLRLKNAEPVTEYYSGPVLFEDEACSSLFVDNLLNQNGLFAYRRPAAELQQYPRTLDDRMEKKIIDSRITVKNYTTLNKYDGIPLLGSYQVDAEGVVPSKEMTLVEKGILKKMLNGCVPTLKTAHSTGSSRYVLNTENLFYTTAPGTVHIQVEEGVKPDKMKKRFIRLIKEEGLEYGYIVRKFAGAASRIYRFYVKDNKEQQVRFAEISPIGLSKLKRVPEISSVEKVSNYLLHNEVLSSLIYPGSILLEDIEIGKLPITPEKMPVLKSPLQR